ncbi:MAG: metalloregulator ArsR/SmtB family transcription factor [Verrucomicrobiota bacterium]
MNAADYRKISDFFNALAHPVRVEIAAELLKDKKCVSDIKELLNVKQPNVSQHLSVLKSRGIVNWRQEGRKKCYYLKNHRLMQCILNALKKNKIHYFK